MELTTVLAAHIERQQDSRGRGAENEVRVPPPPSGKHDCASLSDGGLPDSLLHYATYPAQRRDAVRASATIRYSRRRSSLEHCVPPVKSIDGSIPESRRPDAEGAHELAPTRFGKELIAVAICSVKYDVPTECAHRSTLAV